MPVASRPVATCPDDAGGQVLRTTRPGVAAALDPVQHDRAGLPVPCQVRRVDAEARVRAGRAARRRAGRRGRPSGPSRAPAPRPRRRRRVSSWSGATGGRRAPSAGSVRSRPDRRRRGRSDRRSRGTSSRAPDGPSACPCGHRVDARRPGHQPDAGDPLGRDAGQPVAHERAVGDAAAERGRRVGHAGLGQVVDQREQEGDVVGLAPPGDPGAGATVVPAPHQPVGEDGGEARRQPSPGQVGQARRCRGPDRRRRAARAPVGWPAAGPAAPGRCARCRRPGSSRGRGSLPAWRRARRDRRRCRSLAMTPLSSARVSVLRSPRHESVMRPSTLPKPSRTGSGSERSGLFGLEAGPVEAELAGQLARSRRPPGRGRRGSP